MFVVNYQFFSENYIRVCPIKLKIDMIYHIWIATFWTASSTNRIQIHTLDPKMFSLWWRKTNDNIQTPDAMNIQNSERKRNALTRQLRQTSSVGTVKNVTIQLAKVCAGQGTKTKKWIYCVSSSKIGSNLITNRWKLANLTLNMVI